MKTFRPQQTNQYHFRLIAILVVGVVMVSSSVAHIARAQVMSSGSYSIQADSVNFGGTRSSSGSYALEDTGGEVGTGDLQGTTNILHAGYQQSAAAAAPSTSTSSATQTVRSTSSGGGRLPLNVLNFAATPGTTSIFLSWEYPTGSDIQSVRIVRSATFFPTSLSDGDVIFEGDAQSVIDHNVVKGTRYYYTLFARNTAGFYSSGALAQAQLLSAGEAIVQPPSNPFEQIPDATDVHPVIANLTLLDFDFIQEGKKIAHAGNTVVIDGTKNLTVQLAYDKVPQLLKTIAISLADPQDETRIFTFLLRVNADQTAYEATIAPLTKSGNYRLHAIVLDYKNQGLKRLQGNLRVVVFEGVAGLLERGGMPAIWLWIVVALIVMVGIVMLARRVRRNRRGPGTSVPIYKKILSLIIIGTMVFVSSGLFASPAHAAINKQINYQGKLADSAGDAVADGTYAMHFNLYTTSSGGSTLWTEDRTGANEVQVTDGLFSVMLGSVTSLASVDFNQTLYLGVAIESDSEMTPRKIIGAVPSAFVADTLDGLDSTQFLRADTGSATIGYFVATSTTASVFPNASTTNITIAGKLFDSAGSGGINGQVLKVSGGVPVWGTDNSGSGGGSEINWTYFNGSGVYVSTTTNQVLIGDVATTSNQKLEVIGGAYISGNLGLGTTSPYAKLSVDGRGVFNQDVRANYFTATSTSAASTFPYASTTALTVSGTASTTNLVVSGLSSGGVAVTASGALYSYSTSTWRFASSTLLVDSNTWSGSNLFNENISVAFGKNLILGPSTGLSIQPTIGGTVDFNNLGGGTPLSVSLSTNQVSIPNLKISTLSGLLLGTSGVVSAVSTSSLNIALSDTTGTLAVSRGGTGATTFGQGWIYSNGGTGALAASTSPTVNYVTATSTTQASTFPYASTTALTVSGTNGLQLATGLNGPLHANAGLISATTSIGVLYGGTGLTSIASSSLLIGGPNNTFIGFATSSLGVALSDTTGTLAVNRGGTGLSSYTLGDVLYANGTGSLAGTSTANLKTTLALNNVENTALSTWAGSTNLTTLGTIGTGLWHGTAIEDAYLTKSGNWTGTFDGQEGSYYLDARNLTNFGTPFYTFFSATTTDALTQGSTNKYYADSLVNTYIHASTTIPKTYTANTFSAVQTFGNNISLGGAQLNAGALAYGNLIMFNGTNWVNTATSSLGITTFGYLFPSNATSTLLSFTGGLTSYASTTIGNGTATGGLTVSGNSTTTGNAYFAGNVGVGTTSPYAKLSVVGEVVASQFTATSTTATSTFSGAVSFGDLFRGQVSPYTKVEFSDPSDGYKSDWAFDIANGSGAIEFGSSGGTYTSRSVRTFSSANLGAELGNSLGSIGGRTWDGSTYRDASAIQFDYDGSIGSNDTPGAISFFTSPDGSSTLRNRMIIRNSGNVGIGTTSPYAKLSVDGRGVFNQDVRANYYIATSTSIASIFPYASTTALTVSGTASTTNLIVSGSLYNSSLTDGCLNVTSGLVGSTGSACGSGGGGTFSWTPTTNYGVTVNATTTPIWFQNGLMASTTAYLTYASSTALTVSGNAYFPGSGIWNSSGFVGIGTSSPYAALSVVGASGVVADKFYATSTTATSTFAGSLNVGNGAIVYDNTTGTTSINYLEAGSMSFAADSGVISWIDLPVTSASANGVANSYSANLNGNALLTIYGVSNGSGAVTNTAVGIGTTSPRWKLAVAGIGSFDDYVRASYFTATSTSVASTFPYASTTALTVSGTNGLQLATGLNGPLHANAGLISATTSIGVLYGGTGLTSIASSSLLIGGPNNTFIGFATSSLGVALSDTTGTLAVNRGGTGLSSYTLGDVLYANGTGSLAGTSTANLKTTLALNNVENTALSTWAGSTNLTTLGTIGTGIWNGTTIAVANGGTGATTFGQGWIYSNGGTGALAASTSPTVNYVTATSTTQASFFPLLTSTTATTTDLAVTSVISSLLKTNSLGQLTAAVAGTDYSNFSYLFPSNATSTLLSFTGGLISSASTTIGDGTQAGGLTISGGATTTGNAYVAGTLTSAGQILAPNGSAGAPGFAFTSAPDNGFRYNPAFVIETISNGATALSVGPSEVLLPAASTLGWGSSGVSSADTFLSRDAANTLALKNSTNAQTLNVYGTFTNTSNYERLSINPNSTSINFTSGAAGSGTARPFNFTGANLGIGTSSPYAKLSVDGRGVFNQDVRADYFTATSTSVASTFPYASTTALTVSGTASTTNLIVSGLGGASTRCLQVGTDGTVSANASACGTGGGGGGGVGWATTTASNESIYYYGTGNVAIGTSTPYSKLSVWGSGTGTNRLFELTNNASTTLASVLENGTAYFLGNLGVGTTSPNWKLSVAGIGSFDDYVRASYITATSTTATSTFAGGIDVGAGNLLYDFTTGVTSASSFQTGNLNFDTDAGMVSWTDLTLSSASNGTIEGYTASLNGSSTISVYGISAGSGWLQPDYPRVAIGSSTPPSSKLTIFANGTGGGGTFEVVNSASTTQFKIFDNGVTGVGTTSPFATFAVNPVAGVASNQFVVGSSTATNFIVTNGGRVGIGTTTPWRTLSVTGTVAVNGLSTGAGGEYAVCIDNVTKELSSAGAQSCLVSSRRFKDDIAPLENGLDEVMKLKPSTFTLKNQAKTGSTTDTHLGFIAEEVDGVDKRLVQYEADGITPRTVRYEEVTALLAKAIQEQQLQIGGLASTTVDLAAKTSATSLSTVAAQTNVSLLTSNVDAHVAELSLKLASSSQSTRSLASALDATNAAVSAIADTLVGAEATTSHIIAQISGIDERVSDMQEHISTLSASTTLIDALASSTADRLASSTAEAVLHSSSFLEKIFSAFMDFLASAVARIKSVFVGELHVEDKLCVDDVCINKDQLKALLVNAGGVSSTTPAAAVQSNTAAVMNTQVNVPAVTPAVVPATIQASPAELVPTPAVSATTTSATSTSVTTTVTVPVASVPEPAPAGQQSPEPAQPDAPITETVESVAPAASPVPSEPAAAPEPAPVASSAPSEPAPASDPAPAPAPVPVSDPAPAATQ